jgi:membrane protease YdiL (CAAX protease family)
MLGWLLLWAGTGYLAGCLVRTVYGVQDKRVLLVASTLASVVVFTYATWHRVGWDAVRLGIVPIQNRLTLLLLSVVTVVQVPYSNLLLNMLPAPSHPTIADGVVANVAWIRTLLSVVPIAVVPFVEEMFFRGWLWTDLRRYWNATSVMLFTGFIFLLIHMPGDYRLGYSLLPFVVIVTLARQLCESTKATIWLHFLNNATNFGLVYLAPHGPMP